MSLNSDGVTKNVVMALFPVPRAIMGPRYLVKCKGTSAIMGPRYMVKELRKQCQNFAVDLLHQSRSSQELAIVLNHDPESPSYEDGEHMKLARLELAINYK
ncbi:unnamed protein product, partial [Timema podura]|nr:unnamed protein product [Timema podura]